MGEQDTQNTILGVQRPEAYEGLFELMVRCVGLSLTNRCRAGDCGSQSN